RMAISSMRSWNSLERRSPAPSSSMPARKFATPSLPAGSCALPPSKAKRMAISGTLCSSTSHAVMPPGLFTTWIFMASALLVGRRSAKTAIRTAIIAVLPHMRAAIGREGIIAVLLGFVGHRLHGGIAFRFRGRRDQGARHRAADVQMLDGGVPDVLGGDLADGVGPAVDLVDRQAEQRALGVAPGESALAVGLVDEIGNERLLGAIEFARRHAGLAQLVQDAVDARLHLVEADAWGGNRVDRDAAAVEAAPRVPAACARGELLLGHQLLVEPAGAAVAHDLHEQIEGLGLAGLGARNAGGQVEAAHRGIAGTRVLELHAARGAVRRLLRALARLDVRIGLEGAIGRLRQGPDLVDGDVAGDDDDGVVGGIEALVERQRILP